MVREIVQPDYWTRTREEARVANRLARIGQFKQQYGDGGNEVDFRTHVKNLRKQHNAKLREVLEDPYLPDRQKHDVVADLTRRFSTEMNEALKNSRDAYAAEVDRLDRLANPAPVRGRRDAGEMMERRELREDLEREWARDQRNVLDGYREAVRLGDVMSMELHEKHGPRHIKDNALRMEFADLMAPQMEARTTPEQRAAIEQLEQLRGEESQMMLGMTHQHRLAEADRRNAASGRPAANRDEAIGQMAARGMDTGMMAGIGGRDEQ